MRSTVKVKAVVIEDGTGIKTEIPVLLTEHGDLTPLTDFLLNADREGKSRSWMDKVIRGTQLLIDYMEANKDCFNDPNTLFSSFVKRLYTGTIGDDGLDPSGLFWLPASIETINKTVNALNAFLDWLEKKQGGKPINPLVEADTHTQRINYAAWFKKNQNNFLGHIDDKSTNKTIREARLIKGRKAVACDTEIAVAFSDAEFPRFFTEGAGASKDKRIVLRDQLILLLMHGGGLRSSEALGLWISDVCDSVITPNSADVRLFHPEDGKAPNGWRGKSGSTTRSAYLKEKYALSPRNRTYGKLHLGWKNKVSDYADKSIQLHWFPVEFGILFMKMWKTYLHCIIPIQRNHPYAFISFDDDNLGEPYTLRAFRDNYNRSLRRIGLTPSKIDGYDPHGHRHAYGQRLRRANVNPLLIKKGMHHKSLNSQIPYTTPSVRETAKTLEEAQHNIGADDMGGLLTWDMLTRNGFQDIDPEGLFVGSNPKLRRE